MTRRGALAVLGFLVFSGARSADPPPSLGAPVSVEQELSTIRDQLIALDIEKAQAVLSVILDRSDLREATRVEALDLRAQAHVSSDDLDAAEKDYRAILELRADYAPGREVTSKTAMDRFFKLQASMIGTVRLDVDPKDATVTVDGRAVSLSTGGVFSLVSGGRKLRFMRKGFDTQDLDIQAVARQETLLNVRLVPNARSLVVRTDIDGVAVRLDGIDAGVTTRGGEFGSDASVPAALVIENVAIGEHDLRLSKPCFATESLQENVSVDLVDRSRKLLRVVAMRPARTRVIATGAVYEGELRVDDERMGSLPLTSFAMCPGRRKLEIIASGRVVWSAEVAAEESDLTLDLTPRPSAVLVGVSWPKSWTAAAEAWSLRGSVDPPTEADLTTREGWGAVSLPPGTDLAVAMIAGAGIAGAERTMLYSPALHEVEDRSSPPSPSAPRWNVATLGASIVDSREGSIVLASITTSGPAARAGLLPGDRLVAVGGRVVASAALAQDAIAASGIGLALALDIAPPSGPVRTVECVTAPESRLVPISAEDTSRVVLAAWASVEAAAGRSNAAQALATLAILFEGSGRAASALEAWRGVRAIGGGALAARASYALGAGLQADGKRAEAIDAFGQARTEASRNGDAALAAAASDRLADLGVAPR